MSNVSNARKFFSMSKRQAESIRAQIPDLIALIESQEHLQVEDVIDTLKGFQNYTENKPSEALKQKLSRWVETYGKKHIDIARDAFQILKYSEGVIECDAETLRPLLRACIERRENLLADDQTELDAICKTRSVSPPLRQKSEKSEIREVDTSYSRAAAGRELRENVNVGATPPVSNKAMGLFHHSKNISDEPSTDGLVTNEELKNRAKFILCYVENPFTDKQQLLMTPEQRDVVNILSLMEELKHGQHKNITPEQSQKKSATDGPAKAGTTWNLSFLNLTLNGCSPSTFGYIAILCAAATFLYQNPFARFQGLHQKGALALGSVPASKSNAGDTTPEPTTSSSTKEEPTNSSQDKDQKKEEDDQNGKKDQDKDQKKEEDDQNGKKDQDKTTEEPTNSSQDKDQKKEEDDQNGKKDQNKDQKKEEGSRAYVVHVGSAGVSTAV
jgi:hypothetical protein